MLKRVKSFDGTTIVYDVSRHGSDFIVFLHGAGGSLASWNLERSFFEKKKISTLAIDLRGHGKSGNPGRIRDYSIDKFAKDVLAVLDAEKISKFLLVGHCFGGMVSMMLHKARPDLAKAYVLVDTAPKAPASLRYIMELSEPLILALSKFIANKSMSVPHDYPSYTRFRYTRDYDIRRIAFDIRSTGLREWLYTFQSISRFDATSVLKGIRQKVLLIHGDKDKIFTLGEAKKIKSIVKDASLKVIKGANHIIVLNNPRSLSREIYVFYLETFNA